MIFVLSCLLIHLGLVTAAASTWWIPNVTLLALILAVARHPTRWLGPALLTAFAIVVWAVRDAREVFLAPLAIAGIVRLLVQHWDGHDLRVQILLVTAGVLAWNLTGLWLDGAWERSMLQLLIAQPVLTGASVPLVRALAEPRSAPLIAQGLPRWRREHA